MELVKEMDFKMLRILLDLEPIAVLIEKTVLHIISEHVQELIKLLMDQGLVHMILK